MSRILVAEDSETILLLLRKRLEIAGHDVVTAVNGQEALDALAAAAGRGERPDVILLDAMMPVKSGVETLRELRAAGDETPVLMVSAHRDSAEMRDAMAAGANGAVAKPIDWDELLALIDQLSG